ncbi:hypothetical protein T10_10557 [Trichinella papuae]|uniref:Uncharacterized protein n=1 Tax=Trichinella papuae TaxID=268474 RepID=A0A0V1LY82_9BILA|nr:hypothetical protein T10_10557 [Trichinella papuae]
MHTVAASFFKISREIPNFGSQSFPRKFRNFVNYRLACFAKNGENFFIKIWTFFD